MADTNAKYAAIAMAIYDYMGGNAHDPVSGVITIEPHDTQWNGYAQTMTAHP